MNKQVHDHAWESGAEHPIRDMKFRRKFSVNPYLTLKMKLAEMSFYKDWLHTDRGDPYPITEASGEAPVEQTADGQFRVRNDSTASTARARLLGQHFPYAAYEITLSELSDGSAAGVSLYAAPGDRSAYTEQNAPRLHVFLRRSCEKVTIAYELFTGDVSHGQQTAEGEFPYVPGMRLMVISRGQTFDVYLSDGVRPVPHLTISLPEFGNILRRGTFVNATASLWYELLPGGSFRTDHVEAFLSGGVSHADMKPIRYEDGMPMIADGKLFLTMSSRLEAGGYQSVISWNPSTCEFKLEGALFFDCGDDRWCSDVGASILFNRHTNEWYIWAVAFSHGHVLCHGKSIADLRYGINVVDVELMECEKTSDTNGDTLSREAGAARQFQATLSDDTLWLAKTGDEDPDFLYDEERGKWLMIICRLVTENNSSAYRYFLYESDEPFSGYRYLDKTLTGANTGGSIVRIGGKLHLICGSRFNARAQYNVYDLYDLSHHDCIRCDYDDGGFRGWGTVIPVPCGSRTRYMWITFDRHGGSSYNWSYGNLYVYESDLMNSGYERGISYNL